MPFGNYKVAITVPADHMVGATGMLQNPQQVLSKTEHSTGLSKPRNHSHKPVIIRTQAEAAVLEKTKIKRKEDLGIRGRECS